MTWLLLFAGVAVLLLLWAMRRSPDSSVTGAQDAEADRDQMEEGTSSVPSGPVADPVKDQTGPPDLSKLKAAYQGLSTEALENILEMGARLKPGAEDFLRAEIQRRRESEQG